jgi:ribonucleoside-diphosphate reductase alpha chain
VEYKPNRDAMMNVINMHRDELASIDATVLPNGLYDATKQAWDRAVELGEKHGYRNAQVSLLAPTGTIGFFMDCDTTGIEPDMALVKYKNLVGGGMMKIVNQTVPFALKHLGYTQSQRDEIMAYIEANDTIEGAPHIKDKDLAVFDCAFRPTKGKRSISPMGHVKMMAAVQKFLSGAISKTVNVPNDITPEEIMDIYMEAWRLGLKAIAIYRDGSKKTQPVVLSKDEKKPAALKQEEPQVKVVYKPVRKRLPDERQALTHKFSIANLDGYITVGMYEDGKPGEIFVVIAKEGSVISGLMDAFATSISIGLQYGVPLEVFVDKFTHMRFEPAGFSTNPEIGYAKSIVDYIFRVIGVEYLHRYELAQVKPVEHKIEDPVDTSEHKRMTQTMEPPAPESDPQLELPVTKLNDDGDHSDTDLDQDVMDATFDSESVHQEDEPQDMLSQSLDDLMGDAPVCILMGRSVLSWRLF